MLTSEWQIPQCVTRTRTCPGRGSAIVTSSRRTSGFPASSSNAARISAALVLWAHPPMPTESAGEPASFPATWELGGRDAERETDRGGGRSDERPLREQRMADQPAAERRRGDLRDGAERLREPEHDALLVRTRAARHEARERRPQDTLPERRERGDHHERTHVVDEAQEQEGRAHREEAGRRQRTLAEALHETADESPLEDDPEKPGVREEIADFTRAERRAVPRERALGEEREAGRERREREGEHEELREEAAENRLAEVARVRAPLEHAEAATRGPGIGRGPRP